MQDFDYQNPTKIIFGKDTIGRIGQEICEAGGRKALLIAGGGSIRRNGVYDTAVASLKRAGVEWAESWGVRPNPVISKVREMAQQARDAGADSILAVGGGSVLDSAKAVAGGVFSNDPWDPFETHEPVTRALPIYSVLTLSATGSEMNAYAVITNEDEVKKWAAGGPALYPKVSIIDPSAQASLPWRQTVNGAVDTISHVHEAYFTGSDCDVTLSLGEGIMRSAVASANRLQEDPSDYNARASLAWASTLALNGITSTGTGPGDWATHGIEHGLSAVYPNIAHAEGLAVLFPAWIRFCQDANPATFQRWARNVWGADSVDGGIAALRARYEAWGHSTTLEGLGVEKTRLSEIAETAFAGGTRGSVKKLALDDIRAILESAYTASA